MKDTYKIGSRIGKLVIKSRKGRSYTALCDCGNTFSDCVSRIKDRKSCGCMKGKHSITHGMRNTRFYGIWKGIQGRCYHKSNKAYIGYGSVGVTSDWKGNFLKFKRDMYKSYLYHVKVYGEKNTSIDRLDNRFGYSKKNCKWSTQREQANNKSNTRYIIYKGKSIPLSYLASKLKVSTCTLRARIKIGWPEKYWGHKIMLGGRSPIKR